MTDDELLRRLHELGTEPIDPARQSADLTAMARVRPTRRVVPKLRLAGAFLAGLLLGSTGLAAADVLPDPAQHVAHTVLGRVGVDVPDPERYHGPECGPEQRNHGAYVQGDHDLAKSDCGKPLRGARGDKAAKGPCQGKPSWAGDKTLTPEARAAAQAERAAQCGHEVDGDEPDELEAEADRSETEAPVTTEVPVTTDAPTTAEAPTTTEAPVTTVPADETTTTSP